MTAGNVERHRAAIAGGILSRTNRRSRRSQLTGTLVVLSAPANQTCSSCESRLCGSAHWHVACLLRAALELHLSASPGVSDPPGCEPRNGETSSRVCRLGRPSAKRSVAVIGDSHLRVWMPTILQMAARDGWVVRPLTKPSCLPWRWKKPDAKNPECGAWINWALRRARALHPTVTLIGGAFAPLPHSPGDGGQTTVDAIKSVTAALKPFSKRVVVLGDVPYQTRGIVDCLLSSGASLLRCSAAPTRPQLYDYVAAQARFEGAGFIDVRPWFCYQYLCPMVIGHTIA